MALQLKPKQLKRPIIDLTGPQGNAFFLLGQAQTFFRQMGLSREEIDRRINHMMSHDYYLLVAIFMKEFGNFVDVYTHDEELIEYCDKFSKEN